MKKISYRNYSKIRFCGICGSKLLKKRDFIKPFLVATEVKECPRCKIEWDLGAYDRNPYFSDKLKREKNT